MILVDTSVWIDHLKHVNNRLQTLLNDELVLCHPFVIGELASENLKARDEIIGLLHALPEVRVAEHYEVMHFVNSYSFYGRGLGWIDMHRLVSVLLTECHLWTLDSRLKHAAAALKISA